MLTKTEKIKEYYKRVCDDLGLSFLSIKFERVGKGGAAVTFNTKTNKALYISFDLTKLMDIEYAILHELAHQILLEKCGDPALKHNAKFRKIENDLMEKYMYSKFSEVLYL